MAHCWSNDDTANSLHNMGSCRFSMAVPIRLLNLRIELIDIAVNLFHRKRVRRVIKFTDDENRLQADTVSTRIGQNNALHRSTTRCVFELDSITGSCSVNAGVRPPGLELDQYRNQLIRKVYSSLLHVGNAMDARDLTLLYDNGIRAVIDLAINERPAQLGRDIVYCRFPLNDGDGNDSAMIRLAIQTTVSLIRHEFPTLVACSAGMSRAPTIAAASIAMITKRDPDECLIELIADGPNDVSPILWNEVKNIRELHV